MNNKTMDDQKDVCEVLAEKTSEYRNLWDNGHSKEKNSEYTTLKSDIRKFYRLELYKELNWNENCKPISPLEAPLSSFANTHEEKIFTNKPKLREAINNMILLVNSFEMTIKIYSLYSLIISDYSFRFLDIGESEIRNKLATLAEMFFHKEYPNYAKSSENDQMDKFSHLDENTKNQVLHLIDFVRAETATELLKALDGISGISDYRQKYEFDIDVS